ncbi:MAG: hypothetical protein HY873_09310 [Chloroflexi bacterium]|nr:hypothetical protein [Chloroflexota bacterium]
MPERLQTYAAALLADWYADRTGAPYALERAIDGPVPVFVAKSSDKTVALAVAQLWEPESDPGAEDARQMMEERLSAGNVRGPHVIWVPPRAAVPANEPEASDFVMRAQLAAAPMQPGARNEIDLPVKLQLAKVRDEGGYASVIGGLSRYWTNITDRVSGTVHVNSMQLRRASQSETAREALFDRIGGIAKDLTLKDAVEFETVESWTIQRLAREPLGETGFAIAQSPPKIDPADGTLMRRLVRRRLKDANEALSAVDADAKGIGLVAIYEYAELENVGSFVKSLDPGLYAKLGLVAAIVDGEIRPVFTPR